MMRKYAFLMLAVGVIVATSWHTAHAVNSVVVESKQFDIDHPTCTVGVYITNDVPIVALVLALEFRTSTNGAYIGGTINTGTFKWELASGSRIYNSPLGAADPGGAWPASSPTNRKYPNPFAAPAGCVGHGINSYNAAAPAATPDDVSPDGFLHATYSTGDEGIGDLIELAPGSDGAGQPSFRFVFPANHNAGTFVVDTCCVSPANYNAFTDKNTVNYYPTFTPGTIMLIGSAVKELETGVIPQDYSLEQNYPNPFNAGTVIRFAQPVDGNVRIDVFNILGRKVKTLVNEFRVAGTHQTDWDGRSDDGVQVATGVYFYRITTDAFSSTRKMVLLK